MFVSHCTEYSIFHLSAPCANQDGVRETEGHPEDLEEGGQPMDMVHSSEILPNEVDEESMRKTGNISSE